MILIQLTQELYQPVLLAGLTKDLRGQSYPIVFVRLPDGRIAWRGVGQSIPLCCNYIASGELFLDQATLGFQQTRDVAWFKVATVCDDWEHGFLSHADGRIQFVSDE